MRSSKYLLPLAALALLTSVAEGQSHSRSVPPDMVQFLVDSATGDIHAHHPPAGRIQFRHARIGTLPQHDGNTFYLICAEVAGVPPGGKPTWVPFATIKMATYEQWNGAQAASGWCRRPDISWDPRTDITAALQARYDSL